MALWLGFLADGTGILAGAPIAFLLAFASALGVQRLAPRMPLWAVAGIAGVLVAIVSLIAVLTWALPFVLRPMPPTPQR
jgi:hypothetical protein